MGYVDPLRHARNTLWNERTSFVVSILKGSVQGLTQLAGLVILFDHARNTYQVSARLGSLGSSYFELDDGRAFRFHFGAHGPSRPGPPEALSVDGGMGFYTLGIDTTQQLALELSQRTPAVFLQPDGLLRYADGQQMGYYLWPQMEVQGVRGTGAGERAVSGRAWMEHQWGDVALGDSRWRYLAVIIDHDNTAYAGRWLFFCAEPRSGERDARWSGYRIHPDGTVSDVSSRVRVVEGPLYDVYPLIKAIHIETPRSASAGDVPTAREPPSPARRATGADEEPIVFLIEPIHLHQECRTGLPSAVLPLFWEGVCTVKVRDKDNREYRVGWAVMELAGFR